ncbi:PefC/AfrB family outer membrane usher protein [Escherichia coli]|uniref:PefC/AfrB family outer membrane usher protein n=2 Tax=Escherichia coli TaxID=562 RepID=UPI0004493A48|nr:PefC/AfrB family outer membrane usher protein [Escherichia coli]EFE0993394.1 PefC/AfrB family outer membrane usher protein [Escherichia coli O159:H19]EFP8750633.1 PefC/AfrB family outer membrane usher protein [Shigella flexneri]EKH5995264.1 PefC/AfrB family outer membrane usher protein [Escherichia coli O8]ELP2953616.1 PefC/AfrB family outer membrane usher protein [Escherichia coli O168]ELW2702906.1 PefC/AfrB family outer membrane usher protein [Escherichia coli O26]MCF0257795.1 PefC/AfrB 
MKQCRIFKLSLLALSIYSHFSVATELNLDFIQGTSVIPSILKANTVLPAGHYIVDVVVNNERSGRTNLVITSEDEKNNSLCFTSEWLSNAGIMIKKDAYDVVKDEHKQCYVLSDNSHTKVDFDYGTQTLKFNIPQAYLLSKTDPSRWDYGVNGGRLKYYGNFNKTVHNDFNAFGNLDAAINAGRWVLSSNMNVSHSDNESQFTSSDLTLSTAISEVQGDLLLGKSQTRTELFSDFNFYGAALRSNSNMRPWEFRGYAPDISGIAPTPSRITVKQNGYTVYSKMIPAGPYRLDDLRPMGNGDLLVTVEDESGNKTEQVYPVTTLPTLLRPGEYKYNVAVGKKNNSNDLDKAFNSDSGLFWLGSLDYGLPTTTLNSAFILNDDYQSGGLGITQMLGGLGAMSLSANFSKATYDNGDKKTGQSFSAKYAKSFTDRTDLQLLTYRYQSKGYVEFSDFSPRYEWQTDSHKTRYEARFSHRFDSAYLSGSYWHQDYWNRTGYDCGSTISVSTTLFDSVSLFLNGSYSKYAYSDKDDYSTSLSISVPFDVGGIRHYSRNSIGYNRSNGTSFNTGVSATATDRLNYTLNANSSTKGNHGVSASGSYAFDSIQTNFGISKSHSETGQSNTSLYGGFSGSVLGTAASGVFLSREASKTIGIVSVPGVKGIKFNGSMPTDSNGNTVVWLSEYTENSININMENVPDNLDFNTTSYKVVPTESAIIYRKFDFDNIIRYILRLKDKKGNYLSGGEATTVHGVNAGFISGNGILLMSLLTEPKAILVNTGNGKECSFSTNGLEQNTNKVQEVICD